MKNLVAAARVVANLADAIAWFRILRLHEGVGPVLAGRVTEALRLAEAGQFDRWLDAADCLPGRLRPAVSATAGPLIVASALSGTAALATAMLTALR